MDSLHQVIINDMKRIACPKCGAYVTFDEKAYPVNRVLVFTCPACNKQFKVRCKTPEQENEETLETFGTLNVVANTFHESQEIKLHLGDNVIGRYVKGTNANAPIITSDPSIDTTHCIVTVKTDKRGNIRHILRDAPSNTGTFYQDEILRDCDRINMEDGAIITIGATSMIFNFSNEENND